MMKNMTKLRHFFHPHQQIYTYEDAGPHIQHKCLIIIVCVCVRERVLVKKGLIRSDPKRKQKWKREMIMLTFFFSAFSNVISKLSNDKHLSVEKWQYNTASQRLANGVCECVRMNICLCWVCYSTIKQMTQKRSLSFRKLLIGIKWDILQCLIHHCLKNWQIE